LRIVGRILVRVVHHFGIQFERFSLVVRANASRSEASSSGFTVFDHPTYSLWFDITIRKIDNVTTKMIKYVKR
jgi:hypothetical protein